MVTIQRTKAYDHLLKLLIIGDSGVGKSCLLCRFADDNSSFSANHITTIGVDFKIRTLIIDDERVKIQIWDTAGQERFRTLSQTYYRGAHGILVVFDVTDAYTFNNVQTWLAEIENNCDNIPKILVGNKCDMEGARMISCREAEQFAELINTEYFETSAKENRNIEEVFIALSRFIVNARRAQNQPNSKTKSDGIKINKSKILKKTKKPKC